MIFKPRTKIGVADISDLTRSKVVRWQHNNYLSLLLVMGLLFPMGVAGLGWGDWKGGFFFAGAARLLFVHHVSSRMYTCCCFTADRSDIYSPLSVSTRWLIGSESTLSTTSTLLVTTSSPLWSPSARDTTTSTVSTGSYNEDVGYPEADPNHVITYRPIPHGLP
jgi:hypothetical protein